MCLLPAAFIKQLEKLYSDSEDELSSKEDASSEDEQGPVDVIEDPISDMAEEGAGFELGAAVDDELMLEDKAADVKGKGSANEQGQGHVEEKGKGSAQAADAKTDGVAAKADYKFPILDHPIPVEHSLLGPVTAAERQRRCPQKSGVLQHLSYTS